METPAVGTNGPVAPGAGTPPGADSPGLLPAGYVIINIPTLVPISRNLPSNNLPPEPAGANPNRAVANPNLAVANTVVPQVRIRPTCEIHINNLVDMQPGNGGDVVDDRKKRVALEALKQWEKSAGLLEGKVERRTKQTDKLIYEIYQLVGLYSVFVGVVFTAALQSEKLKCQHIWSPLLLCSFALLIICLVTWKRLGKYNALRVTIDSDEKARAAVDAQIGKLKSFGYERFNFTKDINEKLPKGNTKPKTSKKIDSNKGTDEKLREVNTKPKTSTTSRVILSVLTALTLILAGSFIHIMCLKEIQSRL